MDSLISNRAEIVTFLKKQVSIERFNHCQRVEETAHQFAKHFEVNSSKITPAALLHDVCREYPPDLLLQLATKFGIFIDDVERLEPLLLHGFVGAALVEVELGINDDAIGEAIRFHITGGPDIRRLAQLIYVADFMEPGRTFESARVLRDRALDWSPEQIVFYVYNQTLRDLVHRNYLIHPRTVLGRNELMMKGVKID